MTDLTDEALDALVAQSRSGIQTKSMTMYKGETVDLVETFNLQMRMATTITALRAREAAIVAAAFEVLCNVLHCCDTEAQAIANRISGPRGERNRCPDGVQVLEDAETIIRAAAALVTPSDATAALEAIKRGERNKARRECAGLVALNAWKHGGDDTYSQGMDAGARHQNAADQAAILAAIEPEDGV